MSDDDLLLDLPGLEFGSGIIGVCDICKKRQAVIILQKERYQLCVIDFLNKTWIGSKGTPGRPLPPYRSERVWFETKLTPDGKAPAVVLSPTKVVRHPYVLVTPDLYGLTTSVLEAGIRLAREGFEVLLPDLGKTPGFGPRDHWALHRSRGVNIASERSQRLVSLYTDALAFLRSRPMVDPEKGALVGLSYGGSLAVGVAAVDPRLNALGLLYPMPVAPEDFPRLVPAPTLLVVGSEDARGQRTKAQFQSARASGPGTFVEIPGVKHYFLARDLPAYQLAPAEKAWAALVSFLRQQLLPPPPKPPAPRIVPPPVPAVRTGGPVAPPPPTAAAPARPAT